MRGTLVNVVAVLFGSGIGLAVGNRLPERLQRIITTGLGLSTLLIGTQMALKVQNMLVLTASLVFCVGPMTIVGAIQEGMSGNPEIIYTKSMLDGAASVAFASSLGIGVSFAAVTVLVLQGALTLLGAQLAFLLRAEILNELTATGGLLILTIGLMLLEVKRILVANLLPALVVVVLLTGARLSLGW